MVYILGGYSAEERRNGTFSSDHKLHIASIEHGAGFGHTTDQKTRPPLWRTRVTL